MSASRTLILALLGCAGCFGGAHKLEPPDAELRWCKKIALRDAGTYKLKAGRLTLLYRRNPPSDVVDLTVKGGTVRAWALAEEAWRSIGLPPGQQRGVAGSDDFYLAVVASSKDTALHVSFDRNGLHVSGPAPTPGIASETPKARA